VARSETWKIKIRCYKRLWKTRRCSYHFKYLVVKLNTNVSRCTDLDPRLAYRFPIFGSRGPGLNSHDLGVVNWDGLLSKRLREVVEVWDAGTAPRSRCVRFGSFDSHSRISGCSTWWGLSNSFICWGIERGWDRLKFSLKKVSVEEPSNRKKRWKSYLGFQPQSRQVQSHPQADFGGGKKSVSGFRVSLHCFQHDEQAESLFQWLGGQGPIYWPTLSKVNKC
jgi:hypothetical protein